MKNVFVAIMIAGASMGGYFAYDAYQDATLSDAERMMLANLEALTGGEENPNCPNGCVEPFDHCWCNGYQPYTEYQW